MPTVFWDEVSNTGGSTSGDGMITTILSKTIGGQTYQITQTISYIFPNDFYTVDYEVVVPPGNTEEVDLYHWTDLQLDGDDNGQCIPQSTFPAFAGGDNSAGNYFAGYRERDVTLSWNRFFCGFYADPTFTQGDFLGSGGSGPVSSGYIGSSTRNLPNTNRTSNHDIGAATQWDITNSGGGTFRAQHDFIFSVKIASLRKFFGPADADPDHTINAGDTTPLTFVIENVPGNPAINGIDFTDTLPAGVTIVGTPAASQCGGAVATGTSGARQTVSLTGGVLNGGTSSCTVTLDVTAATAGAYDNQTSDISGTANLKNLVDATLTVAAPSTDLEIDLTLQPAGALTLGIGSYFVLEVDNASSVDASGVTVSVPMPTGYALSDVFDAEENAATGDFEPVVPASYSGGVLTVGNLAAGEGLAYIIVVSPTSSNPAPLTAEIAALDQVDTDSAPGNGIGNGEDDQASLDPTVSAAVMPGICRTFGVVTGGAASVNGLGEYIVTPDAGSSPGFLWSQQKINLDEDFDIELSVYLGTKDSNGADGMTFVVHNDPRGTAAQGDNGGFMGVGSSTPYGAAGQPAIAPSLVVEFDTWNNGGVLGDPTPLDHTAVYLDGDLGYLAPSNQLVGAQSVGAGGNIEDGRYHATRYVWDASANQLTYYFDGAVIGTVTRDLVAHFGSNFATVGFTASTGGFSNLQKACFTRPPVLVDGNGTITGIVDLVPSAAPASAQSTISGTNQEVYDALETARDAASSQLSDVTITAIELGADGQLGTGDDGAPLAATTGSPYAINARPGTYAVSLVPATANLPSGAIAAGPLTKTVPVTAGNVSTANFRTTSLTPGTCASGGSTGYWPMNLSNFVGSIASGGASASGRFRDVAFTSDGRPVDLVVSATASPGGEIRSFGNGASRGAPDDALMAVGTNQPGPSEVTATVNGEFVEAGSTNPVNVDLRFSIQDIDLSSLSNGGANRAEFVKVPNRVETVSLNSPTWIQAYDDGTFVVAEGTRNDTADNRDESMVKFTSRGSSQFQIVLGFRRDAGASGNTSAGFKIDGNGTDPEFGAPGCSPPNVFATSDFDDLPQSGTADGISADYGEASQKFQNATPLTIGETVTLDADSTFSGAAADGDTDDGLIELPAITSADTALALSVPLRNTSGADAWLCGFIDAGADGDGFNGVFDPASERLCARVPSVSGNTQFAQLQFDTLDFSASSGATFLRLRLSDSRAEAETPASDGSGIGEVEGYRLPISQVATTVAVIGTVFMDTGESTGASPHNGAVEGDEPGLGGVLVEALDVASGAVVTSATTNADGFYMLALPTTQFGAATRIVVTSPADTRHISGAAAGASDTDTRDGLVILTPASAQAYQFDFGLAEEPRLTSDQHRSVSPGNTVGLPHAFTAGGPVQVAFSLNETATSPGGAISSIVFEDANCDGQLDAGEAPIAAPRDLAAGERLCLIVRATASAGAPSGAVLGYDLIATATFASTNDTATVTNADTVTVTDQSGLNLSKQVCNASAGACNTATGAGFGLSNSGAPGDVLVYRLVFTAPGPEDVDDVAVYDTTPAYSALTATTPSIVSQPAGLACTLTTPAAAASGYAGDLAWTCSGRLAVGAEGVLSFEVEVQG